MAFEIRNKADSIEDPSGKFWQAAPDKVDFDILAAGHDRDGVDSGCAVTLSGPVDEFVQVASGGVVVDGTVASVSAGAVKVLGSSPGQAADATNPRFTLIIVDNAGVKSQAHGTAAAIPEFPAIPASSIVLAAVYVQATATVIENIGGKNPIVDKRVVVRVIDHGTLAGLVPDDDHTHYALLAGRSGGQTLIGGTGAGDRLILKGNSVDAEPITRIDGRLGMGIDPIVQRFIIQDLITTLTGSWTTQALNPVITLASAVGNIWIQNIAGTVNLSTSNLTNFLGQRFAPGILDAIGGGIVTNFIAADYAPFYGGGTMSLGTFIGVRVNPFLSTLPITTAYGFYSPDWSRPTMTTQKVIKIEDQLLGPGTAYLEELGNSTTPNWRVEATAPTNPGVDKGRSRCLATFNENGVLAVRRHEWKLQSTLVAGDKVMVAV